MESIKLVKTIIIMTMLIPLAQAGFGYNVYDEPTFNNNSGSVNSSDFWDALDTPADITEYPFWYNHTLDTFNLWNSTWDQSMIEQTMIYNHTADTFNIYNSTWDQRYLNIWDYNQSDATFTMWNATWDDSFLEKWDYNQTSAATQLCVNISGDTATGYINFTSGFGATGEFLLDGGMIISNGNVTLTNAKYYTNQQFYTTNESFGLAVPLNVLAFAPAGFEGLGIDFGTIGPYLNNTLQPGIGFRVRNASNDDVTGMRVVAIGVDTGYIHGPGLLKDQSAQAAIQLPIIQKLQTVFGPQGVPTIGLMFNYNTSGYGKYIAEYHNAANQAGAQIALCMWGSCAGRGWFKNIGVDKNQKFFWNGTLSTTNYTLTDTNAENNVWTKYNHTLDAIQQNADLALDNEPQYFMACYLANGVLGRCTNAGNSTGGCNCV